MSRSKKQPKKAALPKRSPKQKRALILLALLLIPVAIGLVIMSIPKSADKKAGPQFYKEGELQFVRPGADAPLKTIDIEIADNERERQVGLMWRRSMEEQQGMLFIMENTEMQTFWMLNTYIPLDILFINDQLEIVTIRKNTQPQSLDGVSSTQPALYVLEVIGGFSDKFGIRQGDRIQFQKD